MNMPPDPPLLDECHESTLLRFEAAWESGSMPNLRDYWFAGDPLPLLAELIHIDIERRIAKGQTVRVESYLNHFPALAGEDGVIMALLQTERSALGERGDIVDLESYRKRFPQLAARLKDNETLTLAYKTRVDSRQPDEKSMALHTAGPKNALDGKERLGRYRLIRLLGDGGMGSVILAEDEQLQRQVALKVPHVDILQEPSARQRFLTEARAAATLRHPNICPVYECGEVDGLPYLTMAYIEGVSLASYLKSKKLPIPQAVAIVRKLAIALHQAHAAGVVHRDLKPANVMLERGGEPVLMDFGLAKRQHSEEVHQTTHGRPIGSPVYMAPEQVEGDVESIGPTTDVYGLGAILYETLTGQPPFKGNVGKVFADILSKPTESPAILRPDLPPGLAEICLKAMAKRPADRFVSAKAFAEALRPFTTTKNDPKSTIAKSPPSDEAAAKTMIAPTEIVGAVAALEEEPKTEARKPRSRRWLAIALAAGFLACVAAAGVVVYWPTPEGIVRIESDDPKAVITIGKDGPTIRGVDHRTVTVRPGRHSLVISRGDETIESDNLTIRNGDQIALRISLIKGKLELIHNAKTIDEKPYPPESKKPNAKADKNPSRETAEWVINAGGGVWIRDALGERSISRIADFPNDHFEVVGVHLNNRRNVADTDLERLRAFPNLEVLQIYHNRHLTGACIESIIGLSKLWKLEINGASLTDSFFHKLKAVKTLKFLVAGEHPEVTDRAMEDVGTMENLEIFCIPVCSRITDRGIQSIARLPKLKRLGLQQTSLTDAGLKHVAEIKSLEALGIGGHPKLVGDGFADLASMPNLQTMFLEGQKFKPETWKKLSQINKLRGLVVNNSNITDADLPSLAGLDQVTEFEAHHTKLTDAGLKHLLALPRLQRIGIEAPGVTPAALRALQAELTARGARKKAP